MADDEDGLEIIDLLSPKENISNIILWSILGILTLLVLVDLAFFIKEMKLLKKDTLQRRSRGKKMSDDEREERKEREEREERVKIDVLNFFKGFLITYGVLIILMIISIIIQKIISYDHWNTLFIVSLSSLFVLGIIMTVVGLNNQNKNPYISMGLIAAIFGSAFLVIKTNGEKIDYPYAEHPKNKRTHLMVGFLLAMGLLILYLLVFIYYLFGMFQLMDLRGPGIILFLISMIFLNVFLGIPIFFFKEKLRYISIGIISSIPVVIFLGLLLVNFGFYLLFYFGMLSM